MVLEIKSVIEKIATELDVLESDAREIHQTVEKEKKYSIEKKIYDNQKMNLRGLVSNKKDFRERRRGQWEGH